MLNVIFVPSRLSDDNIVATEDCESDTDIRSLITVDEKIKPFELLEKEWLRLKREERIGTGQHGTVYRYEVPLTNNRFYSSYVAGKIITFSNPDKHSEEYKKVVTSKESSKCVNFFKNFLPL